MKNWDPPYEERGGKGGFLGDIHDNIGLQTIPLSRFPKYLF